MNPFAGALLSLMALNGAGLSPWIASELYFRRGPVLDLVLALAANVLVLVLVALALRRLLCEHIALGVLRFVVLFLALHLGLRAAASTLQTGVPIAWRLGLALMLAAWAMNALGPQLSTRLMRAIGVAAVAFALAPVLWRAVAAPAIPWQPVAADTAPHNKVILLLDELGDTAAGPIVERLKQSGLQVLARSLQPAGQNTLNVIPAMFSGQPFDESRPCGRSSICSEGHVLDFSKVTVTRPDVDVIGLQHPYCDIVGLRSCHAVDLPHEHQNAYRSSASLYLARLGRPAAKGKAGRPDTSPQQRIVQDQLDAVQAAPFWTRGGVLYAHLALPHPPGHGQPQTLDADYQDNIEKSAVLVQQLATRLKASFGDDYALLIVSDHPLRKYWCSSPYYQGTSCAVRPAYDTARVPLIVASPQAPRPIEIDSNRDVFGKL